MKQTTLFISLTTALVLMFSCKKDDTTFNSWFYTSHDTTDIQLSLYIDDEYKGELPYLPGRVLCGDEQKSQALLLKLQAGKYKIEAKDQNGVVKSSNQVKFNQKRSSVSGGVGGAGMMINEDCLIMQLFYENPN